MDLNDVKTIFRQALPMEEISPNVARNRAVTAKHLVGSTVSLFVEALTEDNSQLLVLTSDEEAAKLLLSDLVSLGVLVTLFFPDLRLDPDDPERVVDTALLVQRSEALDRLSPVSYTHPRAHETSLHLVCRLLLEKKNIECN